MRKSKLFFYLLSFIFQLFFICNHVWAVDITTSTVISTGVTLDSLVVKNWAILTLSSVLTVTWDVTIENGGIITHPVWASTAFDMQIWGTLNINAWWKIDVSEKWTSTIWRSSYTSYAWASHWGYGWSWASLAPYDDLYNPTYVWSYWYHNSYTLGWWLVRMTVWNLINNWSILANASNYWSAILSQWAWGSINITVNSNISWTWIYQANWGYYSSGYMPAWAWGRIAIKYASASDISTLKTKVTATWFWYAWDWTVYLKNNSSGDEYLIVKWDWTIWWATYTKSNLVNVDLNSFKEVIVDWGSLTITWLSNELVIPYSWNIKNDSILNLSNSKLTVNWWLTLTDSNLTISWSIDVSNDLTLTSSSYLNSSALNVSGKVNSYYWYITAPSMSVISDLNMSYWTLNNGSSLTVWGSFTNTWCSVSNSSISISNNLNISGTNFNSSSVSLSWSLNLSSTNFYNSSSLTVWQDSSIKSSSTLSNNWVFNVSWDLLIDSNWTLTHSVVSSSAFNLLVWWTLTITPTWFINMSEKWTSTIWRSSYTSYAWASHWGYGWSWASLAPYDDLYNPTYVWSYWYHNSYTLGWWLVRMTVWNLINNWSILANASNYWSAILSQWAWGSINITVNSNISWTWIYQANWGYYSSGYMPAWAWGRIAIKYASASDISTLKTKVTATWFWYAWAGTIYLMNYTTWQDYLLIKWLNNSSNRYTWLWTWYADYYFDTIEVLDWAKLYKIWTQNIASAMCITWWTPVWVVDPLINCAWTASFRYYDLGVNIKNFDSVTKKYEFLINWPVSWASFLTSWTWTVSWNWYVSTRIKLSKLWTYTFTFNLYDWNLADSKLLKSSIKTIQVKKE